jgi:hypothetical protein
MFWQSFIGIVPGVIEILLLAGVGYVLVKKNILGAPCLDTLSKLTIDVTLPCMIVAQLLERFSFTAYPHWWVFPLLSFGVTLAGLVVGYACAPLIKGAAARHQFISLVGFQNSGYLPLVLMAAVLPAAQAQEFFIYLFLFLAGFNLAAFSLGVYILTMHRATKFDWNTLFSAPVLATAAGLVLVALGMGPRMPALFMRPMTMIGNCTLPLAMFVVGGSLARISLRALDLRAALLTVAAKLIVLPALALYAVCALKPPFMVGLLMVLQCAAPSAVSLTSIILHHKERDILVSHGILVTHLASIVTLPVFLSLYFSICVLQ